jgi:hypothetical protein
VRGFRKLDRAANKHEAQKAAARRLRRRCERRSRKLLVHESIVQMPGRDSALNVGRDTWCIGLWNQDGKRESKREANRRGAEKERVNRFIPVTENE